MLYSQDRQSGKKSGYSLITPFLLVTLLVLTGCNRWGESKERVITMEAFSEMKTPAFVFDLDDIRSNINYLVRVDSSSTEADRQTRNYYKADDSKLVWISTSGIDERADSLLAWLHLVGEIGFTEYSFGVADIEDDLQRMRNLDFGEGQQSLTHVAARLEYRLTKACLRYTYGQRYGYTNPYHILNSLDADKKDTLGNALSYRRLFDVKMDLPSKHYANTILNKVRKDSLAEYLRKIQLTDKMYLKLKSMLPQANTNEQHRRIMVNMERCRWRRHQPIADHGKRIIVNIPAYHLYAYSPDTTIDMRVVCGTLRTKTPQLSSNIEWMEVNPQWIIPMSIVESDITRHVGDSAYFARHRYGIYERATNKLMNIRAVTRQMLLSGKYRVAQQGGAGNSLGRIIFRFKNNFSVFLHDTSNPGAFSRESRAVSHGCVRVSKPFELARFVLDTPDDWLLDRIRISMGLPPMTERGQEYIDSHDEGDRNLIGYVPVKPRVPIYIIYQTLWPDADGVLQTWPDVYGYDEVVWKHLKPYMM